MQKIFRLVKDKVEKLLADETVNRVIGWKKGEFFYDNTPAVFSDEDGLEGFVYDSFCASNLSKYLINESKSESKNSGKILALLKPCDTYSFNQLIKEHRINRDNVYVLGIECRGMIDINKIKDLGIRGIISVEEMDYKCEESDDEKDKKCDRFVVKTIYGERTCKRSEVLLEKCLCCKGKQHVAYDELVMTDEDIPENISKTATKDRFELVKKLEVMTPDERFSFWRSELSRCIRCNACRNVCPACSCVKCVFDNDNSGVASKANTDTSEENLFHIIRAFHVAGRCTDCGECSRVCPQHIPLHLLNRKIIKDINEFYGEYQAGADIESLAPLTNFTKEDIEPSTVTEKKGESRDEGREQ